MPTDKKKPAKPWVFVDTNVFLDFYRERNDATLSLLGRLKNVKQHLISTYQVEMEFLKNRQNVIGESLGNLKFQSQPNAPAIFADSATNKSVAKLSKEIEKKTKLQRKRMLNLLRDPKKNDVVFQTLTELFSSSSDRVLTRDMPCRTSIKRLALRRFLLGYPPRKKNDTSYGDALNWEWIVHCGNMERSKIIIVSRDSDYGLSLKKQNEHFLNDHLKRDFFERTRHTNIEFTDRLSSALKELNVSIPDREVDAEAESLNSTAIETGQNADGRSLLDALRRHFDLEISIGSDESEG